MDAESHGFVYSYHAMVLDRLVWACRDSRVLGSGLWGGKEGWEVVLSLREFLGVVGVVGGPVGGGIC